LGVSDLILEGHSIQRYYRARIDELKTSAYLATIAIPTKIVGDVVHEIQVLPCAVVNAPYFASSELAGEIPNLFSEAQFGVCYRENARGHFDYSLRSRGDFDVSAVAKHFGGGGHKNAAGFSSHTPVHRRV
jgi:hypothetical protein